MQPNSSKANNPTHASQSVMQSFDFDVDDNVLVNGRHAEVKTIKDIGNGNYEVGIVYSEDQKFDSVIYPFTVIQRIDSPIEAAAKMRFEPSWKYDLRTDALRFKNAHLYDPLFSLSTTRVDALPHQIEAVYDRILPSHEQRFLLADDAGLGKTIMAGMVIKELNARGRANRVLIVTPAPLTYQWVRELRELLGLEFTRYDSGFLRTLRSSMGPEGNVWYRHNWIVVSIDFIKAEKLRTEFGATKWDLVIFDEAHKCKAHKYGDKIERTDRYRIGAVLSDYECTDNVLLLTATPHDGNPYPFFALLQLLDPYIAHDEHSLSPSSTQRIVIRRLKEDCTDWHGNPLFPDRHVKTISVEYPKGGPEFQFYQRISDYVTHHYNLSKADQKKRAVGFAMVILQKRMVSSLFAITKSLENRARRLREALDRREEALEALKGLPKELQEYEDEYEDLEDERREEIESHILALTTAENPKEIEIEIGHLEGLIEESKKLRKDTKAEGFLKFVEEVFEKDPDEKLLVFTEYKDTLAYLAGGVVNGRDVQGILEMKGYKITIIHGSMDIESRQRAEEEFRDEAQILVATDAAGEGLNFQFAHIMVNYELPWNPNRLEQRMGRLHRYGQEREVFVHNLLINNTREGMIFNRLLEKIDLIRQELGQRVFDVLGSLLQDVNLTSLVMDLLTTDENQFQNLVERGLDAKIDGRKASLIEKVEKEALIKQNIHLDPQLRKSAISRECHIDHRDMERFVTLAMSKWDTGSIQEVGNRFFTLRVPLEFIDNSLVFPKYEKVTFDREMAKKAGRGKEKATFIAIGHPFLDRLMTHILKPQWGGNVSIKLDPEGKTGVVFNYLTQSKDYGQAIVSEQLQTFWWDASKREPLKVNSNFHWELESHQGELDDTERGEIAVVLKDLLEIESKVSREAVQSAIEFTRQIADKRVEEVEIKEKDANRFFSHKIKRLQEKLKLQKAQAHIRDMALAIRNTVAELEKTEFEYKNRKKKLEREKSLAFHTPQLQSICIVIPKVGKKLSASDAELKKKIDLAGMTAVMTFEREQGRVSKDVSLEFLGYDIRSESKQGTRYIEVKSFKKTGTIEMTENEWSTGLKLREEYWLYAVENALDSERTVITAIRNPTERFESVKIVHRQTRYLVRSWKGEGEKSGGGKS